MPTYRMTAPNGQTYEVDGPAGASDDAVRAEIMRQHPDAEKTTAPAPKADPGLMSKLSDAVTAPFKDARDAVENLPADVARDVKADMANAGKRKSLFDITSGLEPLGDVASAAGKILGAPFSAGAKAAGVLTAQLPDIGQVEGNRRLGKTYDPNFGEGAVNTALMGLGGEGMLAKTNTLRAATDAMEAERLAAKAAGGANTAKGAMASKLGPTPEHAADVKYLEDRGLQLTEGQRAGGFLRRQEEALKSNKLMGTAIRDRENKALESFNTGAYNETLSDVGMRVDPRLTGREAFADAEKKAGSVYQKIMPKLNLEHDPQLNTDLFQIKKNTVSELPAAQQEQYQKIMENRVLGPLERNGGKLTGQQYKDVESSLGQASAQWGSSPDPAHRGLARALDEAAGALADNLERTSDPSVRDELKKANTTWAKLVRLRGAVSNRAASGGRFTVGDLLQSIKRQDKSVGKGSFARGDALLQDFAETANRVIPDRLPDSGTTERSQFNTRNTAEMFAAPVTNGVTGLALDALKGARAASRNPQSALAGVARRTSPLVAHKQPNTLLMLPGIAGVANQAQGQ